MNRSPESARRNKLYKTAKWQALRARHMKQSPWCQSPGCNSKATVLDHLHGHGADWANHFWSGPFICLCQSCHSRKTVRETSGVGGGRVKDGGGFRPRLPAFCSPAENSEGQNSPAKSVAERILKRRSEASITEAKQELSDDDDN